MIYAVSDLHGCYEKYSRMLQAIHLSEQDTLYVLGDVVDRGDGGIRILQDMMRRPNVVALRGNHDYLAHRVLSQLMQPDADNTADTLFTEHQMWLSDGGKPTYNAFIALSAEQQARVLAYMNTFLIYDEVQAGGECYFLAHTVPEKEKMQQFETLMWAEFIVGEPDYDKEYYPDKYIVTGHTPTGLIVPGASGKILKINRHIAIDCGAVYDHPLGCICLDTQEEFYVE